MDLINRLLSAWELSKKIEVLDDLFEKIVALNRILERLESIENTLKHSDSLFSLAERLEKLDAVVRRIETLEAPKPEQTKSNGSMVHPIKEDLHEWNRLKLLSRFVTLAEKAKDIEKEWQEMQQDEYNASFAFQTLKGHSEELTYLYKKGIGDGIKWALNRFS